MFEKNPLFFFYNSSYINYETAQKFEHIFIIANPEKYVGKSKEIEDWLEKNVKVHDYFIKGMVIGFVNKDQAIFFKMTWAE